MHIKILMTAFALLAAAIMPVNSLSAGLMINEIACATSGQDWVEITYYNTANEAMEISSLYVTMYYGTNEKLADEPVTIYSYDRPETSYDDRFAVIHLTAPGMTDETDFTGDTNKNGYLDIYCNNYSSSLWNSDCIVSIDNDDDPSNGGIIDFAAYSSRDGDINSTIESYMEYAVSDNQWTCSASDRQECMIYTGKNGIEPYMSISRKNNSDTNSPDDFAVTKFMTPGKKNIFNSDIPGNGKIFNINNKKISITPYDFKTGSKNFDVYILENCNIRMRIFSSIGMAVYESQLYKEVYPGKFIINWDLRGTGKKAGTGLYIAQIEATGTKIKKSQTERFYVIVSRYR
ncbi:MAG: hypothetical protein JW864_08625 [Spirochaetes bacterium]|nr:hypothetical protein [Spirochaetota bacterium]